MHGSRVLYSKDAVDQRFVDLYKLKRAKENFKIHAGKEHTFNQEMIRDVSDLLHPGETNEPYNVLASMTSSQMSVHDNFSVPPILAERGEVNGAGSYGRAH